MISSTVAELSSALANRQISSVELTRQFLLRISQLNPTLNAFITICAEQALIQASAADVRLASGKAGPLSGIPIADKDIFCTTGIRTS